MTKNKVPAFYDKEALARCRPVMKSGLTARQRYERFADAHIIEVKLSLKEQLKYGTKTRLAFRPFPRLDI